MGGGSCSLLIVCVPVDTKYAKFRAYFLLHPGELNFKAGEYFFHVNIDRITN